VSAFKDLLATEFAPFGSLSETQIAALERHYSLLMHWNRRMNLTRIEELAHAVRLHYCESLFLGKSLPDRAVRIADIGSGAGFPGFPVAVIRPESTVDLIESHQRKAVFLREVCSGLGNVRVVATRAETLRVRTYDWVVSRAVRPSEVLALGLAPQAAVLMSAADLDALDLLPVSVKQIPWGTGRVLAIFTAPFN
jgi:16S rRNA (guanine(527)-N(7))-methyltransferase RsmG